MKLLKWIVASVLVSGSALAGQVTTLNCKTEKNQADVFSVDMENLGQSDMTFVPDENDE